MGASRRLPPVVVRFMETESASGVVLLAAAAAALLWANSPWQHGYEGLWSANVVGSFDARAVVDDGLMALFFFVVGLEIKREVVGGELADRRVAALPVLAALGGMVVPALVYLAIAGGGGGPARDGWGIPMATDIAFALGVLAVVGSRRVPPPLKLFLLTLAIVDDIGAIVVIAVFYGGDVAPVALLLAVVGVAATVVLRRLGVTAWPVLAAVAVATWYATYRSGVHATIAGVALALATPATDAERLEDRLHPWTSFVVLPLFALANAGVTLRSGLFSTDAAKRVAIGVAVGLVLGKVVGILTGAWVGVRSRLAVLPDGLAWRHLAGGAVLGGIGFTVSLFVTALAFDDPALADAARLAVLGASAVAALLGATVLTVSRPRS